MQRDFEQSIQNVYESVLQAGDVAIDVGAHVGRHAFLMAAKVGEAGRVYAIEPLPQCREHMTAQLAGPLKHYNKYFEILDCAVSDYRGQAEFVMAVDALAYSGLQERPYDSPTRLKKLPVRVETLDHLFSGLERLNYLKLDAEGGECHIMRGATGLLARFRPLVTFEFGACTIGKYNITCAEFGQFWFDQGYRLLDVNGDALATVEAFAASAERQWVWDYVAVPAENEWMLDCVNRALETKAMA